LFQAAANLQADASTTITASYTAEGTTVSATLDVTVRDITVYPVSAVITGPATVDENTTTQYTLTVTFGDGSSAVRTASSWSNSNPVAGSIDEAGLFTAEANDTDVNIGTTLTAVYTLDGVTVSANRSIAVRDATNYPTSLAITGPGTVNSAGPDGNATYQYNLTVTYRNGATATRQASAWEVEGINAGDNIGSISDTGLFTTNKDAGGSNRTIKFTATYAELGKNLSVERNVSLVITPLPQSLNLIGPSSVASNSSTLHTATVTLTNGSTSAVTATWSTTASPALATMATSGNLLTLSAEVDTDITISASYTAFGVTVTESKTVTVREVVLLSSISVTGAVTVNSGGNSQYTVTAAYSDSTTQDVTSSATYSTSNSGAGSFDVSVRGRFNAASVTTDTVTTHTFTYTHNGTTRTATQQITVLAPVVAGNALPRYGVAMFSDTDFTGGKDPAGDINYGIPYTTWAGIQDFANSVMTNLLPSSESGETISFNIGSAQYGYFMHPKSLSNLASFVDPAIGFPGGLGGITWTPEGEMGATFGPLEVMYDSGDGQGPQPWLVYRTDWDSLGLISFVVTY
jgi:hypothetical protein